MNVDELLKQAAAHAANKRLDLAAALYWQILAALPNHAGALNSLGMIAYQRGDAASAVDLYQRAISLRPDAAELHFNLGLALYAFNRQDEAVSAFRRVAGLNPGFQTLVQLTQAFRKLELYQDASAACRRAVALKPNDGNTVDLLASTTYYEGNFAEALEHARRAAELLPQNARVRYSYAVLLLMHGDFANGYREFEWRRKLADLAYTRKFDKPQWDGRDISAQTLLVHTEGGYGDAIQYIRFLPKIVGRAKRIVLECQPTLIPLFESLNGFDEIIPRSDSLPAHDFHIPLPSLPHVLKTELSNLPNSVPYVRMLENKRARFVDLPRSGRLTVGFCWCGNPDQSGEKFRAIPLELLAPLAAVRPATFVSLQIAPPVSNPPFDSWVDLTSNIKNWSDTAALVDQLDLVITVDTSIAHLAGTLGKPTWLLTPFVPDYRWLLNRTDSPWYPTMRLFRQQAYRDWTIPLAQVTDQLRSFH